MEDREPSPTTGLPAPDDPPSCPAESTVSCPVPAEADTGPDDEYEPV